MARPGRPDEPSGRRELLRWIMRWRPWVSNASPAAAPAIPCHPARPGWRLRAGQMPIREIAVLRQCRQEWPSRSPDLACAWVPSGEFSALLRGLQHPHVALDPGSFARDDPKTRHLAQVPRPFRSSKAATPFRVAESRREAGAQTDACYPPRTQRQAQSPQDERRFP